MNIACEMCRLFMLLHKSSFWYISCSKIFDIVVLFFLSTDSVHMIELLLWSVRFLFASLFISFFLFALLCNVKTLRSASKLSGRVCRYLYTYRLTFLSSILLMLSLLLPHDRYADLSFIVCLSYISVCCIVKEGHSGDME